MDRFGVSLVILAIVLFFSVAVGRVLLRNFKNKTQKFKLPQKHTLDSHNLFSYLTTCLSHGIETLNLKTPEKVILWKVLLLIKFRSYKIEFYEFNKRDFNSMSNAEFKKENIKLVMRGMHRYEKELLSLGFPKFVLDIFHVWHLPHIDGVIDGIDSISFDDIAFETQIIKQHSVYHSLHTGFKMTLHDATYSIGSLNGKVTKWVKENPQAMQRFKDYINSH